MAAGNMLLRCNAPCAPAARQASKRWHSSFKPCIQPVPGCVHSSRVAVCCSTSAPAPADLLEPGSSAHRFQMQPLVNSAAGSAALASVIQLWQLLVPQSAMASEVLSGSAFELFEQFIAQIEALGPWGPVLFIVTVMVAEMIPLFPTQPLSLASGLLFGAQKGAVIVAVGATLAAFNAYSISKGVGRPLAERIIRAEMGEGEGASPVARQLAAVQETIQNGSFWKQFTAILLLRLTPVVPFSASNYVLGLTPVSVPAYVGGTFVGVSIWAFVYSSLGGASRKLLERGVKMDVLFADLAERSSQYTADIAKLALLAGVLGAGLWALWSFLQQRRRQEQQGGAAGPPPPAAGPDGAGGLSSEAAASFGSMDAEEALPRRSN